MCATRSGDIIDATRRGADRWHAGSAHFGAVRDPAEEPLVAAREVEAVAPGYGEDEQHFLEWLVLSLLLGRGVGYRCQQEYCPPRLHALRVTCARHHVCAQEMLCLQRGSMQSCLCLSVP